MCQKGIDKCQLIRKLHERIHTYFLQRLEKQPIWLAEIMEHALIISHISHIPSICGIRLHAIDHNKTHEVIIHRARFDTRLSLCEKSVLQSVNSGLI